MNLDKFDHKLQAWRRRIAELQHEMSELPLLQPQLRAVVFDEFHSVLEELEVAQEELRLQNESLCQQNIELKKAHQTADRERQRYRELFEFAPDGYLVTDPQGTIQEANCAVANLLDVAPQFLVGKQLMRFIPEPDRQAFQTELTQPRLGDWVREWEVRLQLSQRRLVDVALTVAAVRDQQGQLIGLRWLLREITERKQVEKALQRWANIFQHAEWGVAVDSADGETLQVMNPAFAQMHGYTLDEMIGFPILDLSAPECREQAAEYLRLVDAQGHITVESKHIRKDGSVFPVQLDITSVQDEQGNLLYRAVNLQDITHRKQAEAEREQLLVREQAARAEAEAQERRATFLAEASRLLATSLDYSTTLRRVAELAVPALADWCFIDIVENNQATFDHPVVAACDPQKEQLILELRRRYPPPADADYGSPKVLRTGISLLMREIPESLVTEVARDAEHLNLLRQLQAKSFMIVPLIARERTLGTIALTSAQPGRHYTSADLAMAEELARRAALAIDNARLYQEAQEANRVKDEFLAIVSHELRTPLNAMLGWIQLLRNRKLNEVVTMQALETVERNAKLQTKLIDDILDISRIVQGQIRLNLRPVHLSSIIEGVIENIRPTAELKAILIDSILDSSVGQLMGDSERLQQIVWNLLSNAIKFTPEGGRVEVRLEQVGSIAQVTVKDTGKGITADFLPFLFERFRQADGTITRAHGGLGLGLAIVRHLVEMHNGRVDAFSEGEGLGATFTVQLPILDSSHKPLVREKVVRFDHLPKLDGLQVLVVDDNADTCELMSVILEEYGAQVTAVFSAEEALAAMRRLQPDVLISDLSMPGEDGYSLIRQVRNLQADSGELVPAVALTALARDEERQRALSAGFQIHLPKPVEPATLVTIVASLTGRNEKL